MIGLVGGSSSAISDGQRTIATPASAAPAVIATPVEAPVATVVAVVVAGTVPEIATAAPVNPRGSINLFGLFRAYA